MTIIYDFDGTLTPYSLPQYPLLKQCGYTDEKLMLRIENEMNKGIDFYNSYYKCYKNILLENGIKASIRNICVGAENTQFNDGVLEYFQNFQNSKTGVKHYIVTSGVKDYVEKTKIKQFLDGIYGVTFKLENEIIQGIDVLVSAKKKVDIIKEVQRKNNNTNNIIYFGDGLTDQFAFEYVDSIGGKNVFIVSNENAKDSYKKLNENGLIDKCFYADFGLNSQISRYVQGERMLEQEECEYR